MPTKKSKTILGIDPGTNVTGYGIIEVCGKTMHCVVLGIIDLHRISDPYAKLRHIFDRVCALIDEYRPDEVALESPFFGQNVDMGVITQEEFDAFEKRFRQQMGARHKFDPMDWRRRLSLVRISLVSIAAALSKGCPVAEYAPRRIKQAITGQGGASKEQVAAILKNMLKLDELPKRLDATDGLAVAVCHHFQCSVIASIDTSPLKKALGGGRFGSKSWAEFIASNPSRVKGDK